MSPALDTLNTARDLEAAGFEREKAEAIASAMGRSHERAATKADLEPLATKAELYRGFWFIGAGLVATFAALRFLPV